MGRDGFTRIRERTMKVVDSGIIRILDMEGLVEY